MKQGNLTVHTENIFPIIKKFLYSDHEIFLRELVSNAVDATQKLRMLAQSGEYGGELGELAIEVVLDKDKRTLTIRDNGIGMTEREVEQYINQIAFSGAEAFVEKYKDKMEGGQIIGHFGLGFYSAFMVADKVEIFTKSYSGAEAVHWTCTGTTNFSMEAAEKNDRGTGIVLHINKDSEEFLEAPRIGNILNKYCRFMPVPIRFEGKTINQTEPIWTKQPSQLNKEDYIAFYKELYPFSEEPHFWIHLNVDYPFHLLGVLYFPRTNNLQELQKNHIQLYSSQVFVTDKVEEIVPEFLALLHGVIDSPDIPLNVSRSYLQSDSNVKKISGYIVKKVAEKLHELFKNDRESFEGKWDEVGFFIKYGMLTDEKFYEKATDFFLLQDTEEKFNTLNEYKEKVILNQSNKDNQQVWLYTTAPELQHSYVEQAKSRGYNVLRMDQPIDLHLAQLLEQKLENTTLKRIDADTIDKLIEKDEKRESALTEDQQVEVKNLFTEVINSTQYDLRLEPSTPEDAPVVITQNEFMRRMRDMQRISGNNAFQMPEMYTVIVNTNHPLVSRLAQTEEDNRQQLASYLFDLARLNSGSLKGQELSEFISRSLEMLERKE